MTPPSGPRPPLPRGVRLLPHEKAMGNTNTIGWYRLCKRTPVGPGSRKLLPTSWRHRPLCIGRRLRRTGLCFLSDYLWNQLLARGIRGNGKGWRDLCRPDSSFPLP